MLTKRLGLFKDLIQLVPNASPGPPLTPVRSPGPSPGYGTTGYGTHTLNGNTGPQNQTRTVVYQQKNSMHTTYPRVNPYQPLPAASGVPPPSAAGHPPPSAAGHPPPSAAGHPPSSAAGHPVYSIINHTADSVRFAQKNQPQTSNNNKV